MVGGSNPLTPILDFTNGLIFTYKNSSDFCTDDSCNLLRVVLSLMHLNSLILLGGILFEASCGYNLITGEPTGLVFLLREVKYEDSVQFEET